MESIRKNPLNYIVGGVLVIAGLFVSERVNYLLFHSLAELFSIIVAISLFLIMWNSKKYMENKALVFISIGYLIYCNPRPFTYPFVSRDVYFQRLRFLCQSVVDSRPRYMESLTLFIAFAWPERVNQTIRKVGTLGILTIYFLTTVILVASIFIWKTFPICFVANQGQTEFKIISEYIICLIFVAGILLLLKNRKEIIVNEY